MSTPAQFAACWPTRSCSISTTGAGSRFASPDRRANALFLKELRGLSFVELWRDADRKHLSSILHCVADEEQPFLVGAEARPPGLGSVDIEAVLLPLRHHGLTHSRILGGFAVGCGAALDRAHRRGSNYPNVAARAQFVDASRVGAGWRGASGLCGSQSAQALQTSLCLLRRRPGDLTPVKVEARNSALIPPAYG